MHILNIFETPFFLGSGISHCSPNSLFLRERNWGTLMPGMILLLNDNFWSSYIGFWCFLSMNCTLSPTLFIGLFASASKTSGPPSSRVNGNVLPRASGKIFSGLQLCITSANRSPVFSWCSKTLGKIRRLSKIYIYKADYKSGKISLIMQEFNSKWMTCKDLQCG